MRNFFLCPKKSLSSLVFVVEDEIYILTNDKILCPVCTGINNVKMKIRETILPLTNLEAASRTSNSPLRVLSKTRVIQSCKSSMLSKFFIASHNIPFPKTSK